MKDHSSGYVCYCSKTGHTVGTIINWNNDDTVSGYECSYPNCDQDCDLVKEYPIGFKQVYPRNYD